MCAIDNVAFNSYMPDEVYFSRESKEKTIYQGNSYCSFLCEKEPGRDLSPVPRR